jgi:uncharacterized protein YuzE
MAVKEKEIKQILRIVPDFLHIPYKRVWAVYDQEADVLYLNFKKPSHADDSEMTDDDVIIRYERNHIIGLTILNASKRLVDKKRSSHN